jgi:hypothetical protein
MLRRMTSAALTAACLLGCDRPSADTKPDAKPDIDPPADRAGIETAAQVEIRDLLADFKDPEAGKVKWAGKWVTIAGVVDSRHDGVVGLAEPKVGVVNCLYPRTAADRAAADDVLNKRGTRRVVATGKVHYATGAGGVHLRDCRLSLAPE